MYSEAQLDTFDELVTCRYQLYILKINKVLAAENK
jgi:hypothetical protein